MEIDGVVNGWGNVEEAKLLRKRVHRLRGQKHCSSEPNPTAIRRRPYVMNIHGGYWSPTIMYWSYTTHKSL